MPMILFVVLIKTLKKNIFSQLNEFDPNYLKFTAEYLGNTSLPFLDTQVILNSKNELELKKYKKPMASDVVLNFHAISPKKYKIGCLKADIHRCEHTTSNDKNRDEALLELKKLYLKNQYPEKLINRTIDEIKQNKFQPNTNRDELKDEIKNHPERFYSLTLDYSSPRCDKIMYKLFRILKSVTPEYKLNIAWRNLTVSQYYSPRLKLSIDPFCKPGINYSFKCPCNVEYIGETKRQLISRIKEHNRPSSESAISDHIFGSLKKQMKPCDIYNQSLFNCHGEKPTPAQKLDFIKNCFSVKQANLTNYNFRKDHEAILIRLNNPTLNAQVAHRNITII